MIKRGKQLFKKGEDFPLYLLKKHYFLGFPGGSVVKNLPANAGDMGSIPDLGRSHMPWSS